MTEAKTITVSILDKDYQVNCKPEEVSALQQSAQHLDLRMREVKNNSSVLGLDRIAVMAALNIANEFLLEAQKNEQIVTKQTSEIQHLSRKLDHALSRLKAHNN